MRTYPCDCCGLFFPLHLLDSKPARFAGPGKWYQRWFPSIRRRQLSDAIWANEDFDRMECKTCYGPGWVRGVEPFPYDQFTGGRNEPL